MFSIIIPTFNEAPNIKELIRRINQTLKEANFSSKDYEILVVDDNSPDGTAEIAKNLGVNVLLRKNKRGLSSAVIDGFLKSKGDILCVLDADLSHPPELIPKLLKELDSNDLVLASRLVKGGGAEEWPTNRKLISWIAQAMARPLTPVKDKMSGFFALKRDVIKDVKLSAYGYKILLEILVLGRIKSVKEVPFTFQNRTHGQSKITLKVELEYIAQLFHLYLCKIGLN